MVTFQSVIVTRKLVWLSKVLENKIDLMSRNKMIEGEAEREAGATLLAAWKIFAAS